MHKNVIVLGASNKPDRYSYKALQMLREHGYVVRGVHPKLEDFENFQIFPTLSAAAENFKPVDTITLYINPKRSMELAEELLELTPRRVIMNPGSENSALKERLEQAGIEVIEACTLVLLSTDQF